MKRSSLMLILLMVFTLLTACTSGADLAEPPVDPTPLATVDVPVEPATTTNTVPCEEHIVVYETTYGDWHDERIRSCAHGRVGGVDKHKTRTAITTPLCSECPWIGEPEFAEEITGWYCH